MKSTIFLFTFLMAGSFQGKAQELSCRHANPTTESLKQIRSLTTQTQKSTDRKIIPVVFHVLHQNGYENIADAQIQDALQNLNADFQRMNTDSAFVTAPFDTIRGNANFEFRLATIDPDGNPTNGIERIATPLTNVGDETAMIHAWDYKHYVNIWVVRLTLPGLFGFTSNPLISIDPCHQGIVILHSYVGSIGTSSEFLKHILSHEMGHYFGLFHTWGNQDPGQTCNYSDGITDTPVSKGNTSCTIGMNSCDDTNDAASFAYWGFDPRDNYENFMDFSYCLRMFTKGQAELMRSVAESPLYGRDQLWTSANLIATGTGPGTAPVSLAAPSSDFSFLTNMSTSSNAPFVNRMICAGDDVQFVIQNGSPTGTTYSWNFPGATPATATGSNPTVNYPGEGYYNVTLTASNANGSTTTTKNAIVFVSADWPEFVGPTVQDFNASGAFWQSQNTNQDNGYFHRIATTGIQNSGCFILGNHYEPDTTAPCYETSVLQLNQNKDNLVSPSFELWNTSAVTVSFDYAYGSAAVPDSATEILKVYYSRDCGKTWIQKMVLADTALITAFAAQSANFIPSPNQWKHVSFPFVSAANDTRTRFKFEFVASNYSNNFYLDNFVVDGVLGISSNELSGVTIYPNPSQKGGTIGISGLGNSKADLTIRDIQGKLVYQQELSGNEAELNTDLKAGCYLVEITQNGSKFLTRLVVE